MRAELIKPPAWVEVETPNRGLRMGQIMTRPAPNGEILVFFPSPPAEGLDFYASRPAEHVKISHIRRCIPIKRRSAGEECATRKALIRRGKP